MLKTQNLAWLFGITSLLFALTAWLSWDLFDNDEIRVAGQIMMYALLAGVAITACCLVVFMRSSKSSKPDSRESDSRNIFGRQITLLSLLLLANLAAAAWYGYEGFVVGTRYSMIIINNHPATLDDVHLTGGGVNIEYGNIPQGQSITKYFRIKQNDQLELTATLQGVVMKHVVDNHVTVNLKKDMKISISSSGQVTILDLGWAMAPRPLMDLSQEPLDIFTGVIADPVPADITNIQGIGVAFQDYDYQLRFNASPKFIDELISRNYKPATWQDIQSQFHMPSGIGHFTPYWSPQSIENKECYIDQDDGSRKQRHTHYLVIDRSTNTVYFSGYRS